jgi:cytochrome c553
MMIALVWSACAHGGSAKPPKPVKPAEPAPTKPSDPTPARLPTVESSDHDARRAALGAYMPEHFQIVTWARDSVINGELELMREPLLALAAHEYDDVTSDAWLIGIGRLQRIATVAADARTLAQASDAVAAMANECGRCHREMAPEPVLDTLQALPEQPPGETLGDRMLRHGWALDRMWEGMVLPSERAWMLGANALAHAPERTPALPPQAQRDLEALKRLGADAADAPSWEARTEVYGKLLAACASCHSGEP